MAKRVVAFRYPIYIVAFLLLVTAAVVDRKRLIVADAAKPAANNGGNNSTLSARTAGRSSAEFAGFSSKPDGFAEGHVDLEIPSMLDEFPSPETNEIDVSQPHDVKEAASIVDKIESDLKDNFVSAYRHKLRESAPQDEIPVRTNENELDLNGDIRGLDVINVTKNFEAFTNSSSDGKVTDFHVRAEVALPELVFDFDLVQHFRVDVLKLFPVRGHGKATMKAYLPLETHTSPLTGKSLTGCTASVGTKARVENVHIDVQFTNALGRALDWIKNNLRLDLTNSIVKRSSKVVGNVVTGVLQEIICGSIEGAAKIVVRGVRN